MNQKHAISQPRQCRSLQGVHRVSSRLLGPVDPSFQALSGRLTLGHVDPSFRVLSRPLKCTVRRLKCSKDSLPRRSTTKIMSRGSAFWNLIQTSIHDKYSNSMKTTTHLYHIAYFKGTPGQKCSNGWTNRMCFTNTRQQQISTCDLAWGHTLNSKLLSLKSHL